MESLIDITENKETLLPIRHLQLYCSFHIEGSWLFKLCSVACSDRCFTYS